MSKNGDRNDRCSRSALRETFPQLFTRRGKDSALDRFVSGHDFTACGKTTLSLGLHQGTTSQAAEKLSFRSHARTRRLSSRAQRGICCPLRSDDVGPSSTARTTSPPGVRTPEKSFRWASDAGIWLNPAAQRRQRCEPGAQAPGKVGNFPEPRSGDKTPIASDETSAGGAKEFSPALQRWVE